MEGTQLSNARSYRSHQKKCLSPMQYDSGERHKDKVAMYLKTNTYQPYIFYEHKT